MERSAGGRIRVMTFNIRYDEPADGRHGWPQRRELAIDTIRDHAPDLLGLQEPMSSQWDEIAAALPNYTPFGVYRDEWDTVEPHGGFVRTSRFDCVDSGLFWVSDTPDVPQSVSWPNDYGPRACGWVRLRDRQADRVLVFAATHLDTNAGAWLPSAGVLHRELDRIAAAAPIVLVGDFNCAAGSDAHRYLCTAAGYHDAWRDAGRRDEDVITFHGFTGVTALAHASPRVEELSQPRSLPFPPDAAAYGNYRIDWILTRGLTGVTATIDDRRVHGRFPSDHYPVVADLEWAAAARNRVP